jgi:hypothetical protein
MRNYLRNNLKKCICNANKLRYEAIS